MSDLNSSRAVIPEFSVACRRLTPGPGYLEALCEDNVRVLVTPRLWIRVESDMWPVRSTSSQTP